MGTAETQHPIGRAGGAERQRSRHPSAPLPEVGPTVATGPRVALGETGLSAFPFALGTAEFARLSDAREVTAILDRYAQAGGNAIHVSDRDPDIASLVGDWIRARRVRDDVVIVARIASSRGSDFARGAAELARTMGVDRLDVAVIDVSARLHGARHLEQTLADAEGLVRRGAIRALGAHGLGATELLEARVLASGGYPRIHVLDVPYGLGDRDGYESDLLRIALPQRLAVMPVHAVPRGILLARPGDAAPRAASLFSWRGRLARALAAVAREAGLAPAATALAWVRAQPGVAAPVVDAFAAHQIDALAPAATAELTRQHAARLDRAGAR